MAANSIKHNIEITNKEQAEKFIKAIEKSQKAECPECGCRDGNNAQECTIYYNDGYGKRK